LATFSPTLAPVAITTALPDFAFSAATFDHSFDFVLIVSRI
jgi:hypothetical protein